MLLAVVNRVAAGMSIFCFFHFSLFSAAANPIRYFNGFVCLKCISFLILQLKIHASLKAFWQIEMSLNGVKALEEKKKRKICEQNTND